MKAEEATRLVKNGDMEDIENNIKHVNIIVKAAAKQGDTFVLITPPTNIGVRASVYEQIKGAGYEIFHPTYDEVDLSPPRGKKGKDKNTELYKITWRAE